MTPNRENAITVASIAHLGQVRKYTGEPYITHCIEVARRVESVLRDDEDAICAAILHDTVEDGPITTNYPSVIRSNFGDTVAKYVWYLTKTPEYVGTREERKKLDCMRLATAPDEVLLIKIFDVMHNTPSIRAHDPSLWSKFKVESKTLAYAARFSTIIKRFAPYGDVNLVNEYNAWFESLED